MLKMLQFLKGTKQDSYYELRDKFLFHSNKLEGSTFSLVQLNKLAETGIVTGDHSYDDIVETKNSIELFDYMIESLDVPITLFKIREYHQILKSGTSDEKFGQVGKFKTFPNILKNIDLKLSDPINVESDLTSLLEEYDNMSSVQDVVEFHAKFELIHPFSDGNGRIGRILIIEQCLKNNIDLFYIDNSNVEEYKKYLFEIQKNGNIEPLLNLVIEEQDKFKEEFSVLHDINKAMQHGNRIQLP